MKLAKLAKVGKVGGVGAVRPVRVDTGPMTGGGVRQLDLVPEQLRVVARRIGDTRAKRVWKLMQRVQGSLPELCTYDWLERRKLGFQFQSGQMGGRRMSGGAVVDFIVDGLAADGLYVWRVQGRYWHAGVEVEAKDEVQKARLLRLKIGGIPVVAVVDLDEYDVYDDYPKVFRDAEMGISSKSILYGR